MKTSPQHFLRLLLTLSLGSLAQASLRASDEGSTATAKLSSPGKPATLRVDLAWADLHITGVDSDTVTVESSLNQKGGKETRDDGLRRLDEDASFELTEHDNVVTLTLAGENPWGSHDGEFKISVPRSMALDVKTGVGGDLEINNVDGDIEVNNMNGEVKLEGISGSTVVNTMNGEVHASYAKPPQKLVSITSMNGEIDLRVPAETKANIRLRTHTGSILTDFDDAALKTKTEGNKGAGGIDTARIGAEAARMGADAARAAADAIRAAAHEARDAARAERDEEKDDSDDRGSNHVRVPRPPRPPNFVMPPVMGGKLVSGTLNGGGIDIKVSTMNGEITLRRSEPATDTASSSEPVAVNFQNPDKFTDVRERHSNETSTEILEELRQYVQRTAGPLLSSGSKLTVTFMDIDLAGDIRPDKDDIRVMTSTTLPRAHLKFRLVDANGKVRKEGDRRLSDLNYQNSGTLIGRDDPLYYDKQLLKDWLSKELRG